MKEGDPSGTVKLQGSDQRKLEDWDSFWSNVQSNGGKEVKG